MKSFAVVALVIAAALAGCDNKPSNPTGVGTAFPGAGGSGSAGSAAAGSAGSAGSAAVAVADAAPAAAEQVEQTGVLGFELVARGGKFTVRKPTFEVTFPARPQVTADGGALPAASMLATIGGEELGVFVIEVPATTQFDVDKGLAGARDGALGKVGAKLISESPTTLGGIPAKKVTATADSGGTTQYLELYLTWDDTHRTMVGAFAASPSSTPTALAREFIASIAIRGKARVSGVTTDAGVLGLKLTDVGGGSWAVNDNAYQVTFPSKPNVEASDQQTPDGKTLPGAVVTSTVGQDQGFGFIYLKIPAGIKYDPEVGITGARDGMIKQIGGKLTKESQITLGGLAARRALASVEIGGKQLVLEMQFAWDVNRRAVIGLYTATPAGTPSAEGLAFLSSFKVAGN